MPGTNNPPRNHLLESRWFPQPPGYSPSHHHHPLVPLMHLSPILHHQNPLKDPRQRNALHLTFKKNLPQPLLDYRTTWTPPGMTHHILFYQTSLIFTIYIPKSPMSVLPYLSLLAISTLPLPLQQPVHSPIVIHSSLTQEVAALRPLPIVHGWSLKVTPTNQLSRVTKANPPLPYAPLSMQSLKSIFQTVMSQSSSSWTTPLLPRIPTRPNPFAFPVH